jgi:hypothetical protein
MELKQLLQVMELQAAISASLKTEETIALAAK